MSLAKSLQMSYLWRNDRNKRRDNIICSFLRNQKPFFQFQRHCLKTCSKVAYIQRRWKEVMKVYQGRMNELKSIFEKEISNRLGELMAGLKSMKKLKIMTNLYIIAKDQVSELLLKEYLRGKNLQFIKDLKEYHDWHSNMKKEHGEYFAAGQMLNSGNTNGNPTNTVVPFLTQPPEITPSLVSKPFPDKKVENNRATTSANKKNLLKDVKKTITLANAKKGFVSAVKAGGLLKSEANKKAVEQNSGGVPVKDFKIEMKQQPEMVYIPTKVEMEQLINNALDRANMGEFVGFS